MPQPNMPMTAVGKIAKPVLRHEARRRTAAGALEELLAAEKLAARVEVREDAGGTHVARVVLSGCASEAQSRVRAAVAAALDCFTFAHEVAFA